MIRSTGHSLPHIPTNSIETTSIARNGTSTPKTLACGVGSRRMSSREWARCTCEWFTRSISAESRRSTTLQAWLGTTGRSHTDILRPESKVARDIPGHRPRSGCTASVRRIDIRRKMARQSPTPKSTSSNCNKANSTSRRRNTFPSLVSTATCTRRLSRMGSDNGSAQQPS